MSFRFDLNTISIILCWSLLHSCVSPLEFEPPQEPDALVVDGFISDDWGPHVIWVTRMAPFTAVSNGGTIHWEEDALLTVEGDDSTCVELTEQQYGRYLTPDSFQGVPGVSYILRVQTTDGKVYLSEAQTLKQGPEIDTLITRFSKLPSSSDFTFRSGVEILSRWRDPPGERNFQLWTRHFSVYKILTVPPPDPNIRCCNICWITDVIDDIRVHEDLRQDGEEITEMAVFIEDDSRRFRERYYIDFKQYTISAEAYEFYRLLRSQLDIEGSIFDPPVARIRGNMRQEDDPDALVLGYFGAYGVRTRSLFFNADVIEERQPEPRLEFDCREIRNSTQFKPDFWVD